MSDLSAEVARLKSVVSFHERFARMRSETIARKDRRISREIEEREALIMRVARLERILDAALDHFAKRLEEYGFHGPSWVEQARVALNQEQNKTETGK